MKTGLFDIAAEGTEGYCFPATYDFEAYETAESALGRMLDEGRRRWTSGRSGGVTRST